MSRSYRSNAKKSNEKRAAKAASKIENGHLHLELPLPMVEAFSNSHHLIQEAVGAIGMIFAQALLESEVISRSGAHYSRKEEQPQRWGKDEGHFVFAGRKVPIKKPRLRQNGKEVKLESYQSLRNPEHLESDVHAQVVRRVAMRDYERATQTFLDGYGTKKSSVSRHFVKISTKKIQELLSRRLEDLNIKAIFIDAKEFQSYNVIVALGLDIEGKKHVLGFWDGATENSTVCGMLLDDLLERGLSVEKDYLFILDGSKALRKAVRARFASSPIQRCQIHKARNVEDHLPKEWKSMARQRLNVAYGLKEYESAKKELLRTVAWLKTISASAAHSLEEGLDETLTVHRLELPDILRRSLSTTNPIESLFSTTGDLSRNVKTWKNTKMIRRWIATMCLEAEQKMNRIRGYRSMSVLDQALSTERRTSAKSKIA